MCPLDRALFRESFCQDLDDDDATLMAVTQKPIAARCFEDKSGAPAWKIRPSWYQVSEQDHMIPPDTQREMAQRLAAQGVISLAASHASLASRAAEVTALIEDATRAIA